MCDEKEQETILAMEKRYFKMHVSLQRYIANLQQMVVKISERDDCLANGEERYFKMHVSLQLYITLLRQTVVFISEREHKDVLS